MKEMAQADICSICGGQMRSGTTTFTAELGFGVVVIRKVPATVCSQCGADWIADDVAERIEALVDDARHKRLQVEVMSMT
jgi:YgiT-type zinc finger domain-containing protein